MLASCKTLATSSPYFEPREFLPSTGRTTDPARPRRGEAISLRTSRLSRPHRWGSTAASDPIPQGPYPKHVLQLFAHREGSRPRPAAAEATTVVSNAGGTFRSRAYCCGALGRTIRGRGDAVDQGVEFEHGVLQRRHSDRRAAGSEARAVSAGPADSSLERPAFVRRARRPRG